MKEQLGAYNETAAAFTAASEAVAVCGNPGPRFVGTFYYILCLMNETIACLCLIKCVFETHPLTGSLIDFWLSIFFRSQQQPREYINT